MLFACVCVLSFVHLFAASWTVARQAVHGLFQARIREPMLFLHPVDLPNPGIEPTLPASPALAGRFITTLTTGKPLTLLVLHYILTSDLEYIFTSF